MEQEEPPNRNTICFSNSPRRWTQVIESMNSPTRSVHPEHMESMHSQADFQHRTTDFFENESSGEEGDIGAAKSPEVGGGSPTRRKRPPPSGQSLVSRCEPKRVSMPPDSDGYERLDSTLHQNVAIQSAHPATPSLSSYHGSVEELDVLPGEMHSAPQFPKPARTSGINTDRSSRNWNSRASYQEQISPRSDQQDPRVGVHFLAHDFLLRGMLADEELLRRGQGPETQTTMSGARNSLLPAHLRPYDPRSPKDNLFNSAGIARSTSSLVKDKKKVHVVPPPIDTSNPRESLPADYVRTPYPFTARQTTRHKNFDRDTPTTVASPAGATESVLTLSIRKCNSNSKDRITTVVLPASNDYSAVRSTQHGEKEKHYKAMAFDDEQFFRQLRASYVELTGPMRYFLARSLSRIVVSGPASQAADTSYGWLSLPRSPRLLAYKGLSDTFSEDKVLQLYKKPVLGKSRYAFVHWAHRLAGAPSASPAWPTSNFSPSTPSGELIRRSEQPEGLEFVVSWSIKRILLAVLTVILLSIAAALLWIFLGKNTTPLPVNGGFRGAGDRVGSGILIGISVFLIGSSGVAGWLGVSWLVM